MRSSSQQHTPYATLPETCFWRSTVAREPWENLQDLYRPRFAITSECGIATAGSCFAQHIARHLRQRGFRVLDFEPAPPGLSSARAREYGYGIYSGRYGNIYALRQLLQIASAALGESDPVCRVWDRGGRFYDALRPGVEPFGLDSPEEVAAHRTHHLRKVRELFLHMDVLIFTLGLTEAWVEKETGLVFPSCPGVLAGEFDPQRHEFRKFTYTEVVADFLELRALLHRARASVPRSSRAPVRYVLTVSPVPLTATATGRHVLPATLHSKATLRAAAGDLADQLEEVDYFPAYEIVSSPWSSRTYYAQNRREVSSEGVDLVMNYFFRAHGAFESNQPDRGHLENDDEDVLCDEVILESLEK